jgi:broad specificity phosphatase PhoE
MNINDKEIYLIRHGETMWNVNGLPQGSRNDIPLNMIGKEQSLITGDYLNNYEQKYSNFDLVICSPMIRAKETAEIICKKIGYDHNKIIYFEELFFFN